MESEDKKYFPGRGPDQTSEFELKFDSYYRLDDSDLNKGFDQTSTILLPSSPIIGIKNIIQSMDYGVTREMVERIQAEVAELKSEYHDDKYIGRLLKMIDSLVRHIKKRKADAHPASLDLLHSVFDCLEDLVLIPEIGEDSKKKMVKVQTEKFKELKEELSLHTGEEKGAKSGSLEKSVEKAPQSEDRSAPDLFEDNPEDTLTAESEASAEAEIEPRPESMEITESDEDQVSLGPDETSAAVGLEEFDLTEADEASVLEGLLADEVETFEPPRRPHIHPLEAVVSNETDTDTQIFIQKTEQEPPESLIDQEPAESLTDDQEPPESLMDQEPREGPMEQEPIDSLTRFDYEEDTQIELGGGAAEGQATDEPQVVLSSFIDENQDVDSLVDAGPSVMADHLSQAGQGKTKHERGDWISTSDLIPEEFRTKEPDPVEEEAQTEEDREHEDLEDTKTDISLMERWRDRKKTSEIEETSEVDPELKAISDRVERLYDKWATIGDDTTTKILSQLGIDDEVLKGPEDQAEGGPDAGEFEETDLAPETIVEADREPDYSELTGDNEAESGPVGHQDPDESTGPIPDENYVSGQEAEEMGLATQEFEIEGQAEPAQPEHPVTETGDAGSAVMETGDEVLSEVPTSAYDLEALGPDISPDGDGSVGDGRVEQSAQSPDPVEERIYGEASPIVSGVSPHEILAFTLQEIKQTIRAEFQALAAELRLWRNTK